MDELLEKLVNTEELEQWPMHCSAIDKETRKGVLAAAQRFWLERKESNNSLYLHPDVITQLRDQNWVPGDLQKRMIWASVMASADGPSSKKRFKTIKRHLLKKYGRDWWEDVYERKNPPLGGSSQNQ